MNLPNKLTMLRILLIPVFMVVLYWGFPGATWVAVAIFIIASFTDLLDGKIARKYNLVTDFGKFADPLADKMLVTAALLAFAYCAKPRQKAQLSYRDAFLIGVAQAVAALPGLSRSGSTIATGLLLGNRKQTVAQFSFLMVLAPILGETFLELMKGNLGAQAIGSAPLAAGFVAAFVVGCLACKFMIEIVKRGKLVWFALYCAAAGTVSILSYVL